MAAGADSPDRHQRRTETFTCEVPLDLPTGRPGAENHSSACGTISPVRSSRQIQGSGRAPAGPTAHSAIVLPNAVTVLVWGRRELPARDEVA